MIIELIVVSIIKYVSNIIVKGKKKINKLNKRHFICLIYNYFYKDSYVFEIIILN